MDSQLTIAAAAPGAAAEAVPAVSLAARVEHINTLAAQVAIAEERARQAGAQAWQLGIMLGYVLCCLKAEVGHGEFGKLFKNNSKMATRCHFAYRSARLYMSLYKDAEKWCKRHSLSMCGGALPDSAELPAELSMRGAMQLFREDAEGNDLRPAPKFTAPNTSGRIRKGGEEVSEQARVDVLTAEYSEELRVLIKHLDEYVSSGRHTLADDATRAAAMNILSLALRKIKEVK